MVTYFVYADEGLVAEYDASGAMLKGYGWQPDSIWGTNPVFMVENGQYYYYHNDHLGTPQKITNSTGIVVWSAEYAAFGAAAVDQSSTVVNNLRFPGQYFDEETGLHYNWHRYHDPETGRYTQVDPIGLWGGINVYEYADSNPIRRIDVYGLASASNLSCEAAVKAKGRKGLLGMFLTPLIDKMPESATRGLVNVIVGVEDAKFGFFVATIGVGLSATYPTVVGGVGSAFVISAGVTQTGLGLANAGAGLHEFVSNGGFSGVYNEIRNYINQQQ